MTSVSQWCSSRNPLFSFALHMTECSTWTPLYPFMLVKKGKTLFTFNTQHCLIATNPIQTLGRCIVFPLLQSNLKKPHYVLLLWSHSYSIGQNIQYVTSTPRILAIKCICLLCDHITVLSAKFWCHAGPLRQAYDTWLIKGWFLIHVIQTAYLHF